MGQPQLSYLVGQAVNHAIGQMAIGHVQGGSWEVESVTRNETRAAVVFRVGFRADGTPDTRPRVTMVIAAHTHDIPAGIA